MSPKATKLLSVLAVTGVVGVSLVYSPASRAFDFGNMMNPSKWMGGGDRYDDYDDGPYGRPWGGPYGGGPPGGPYGGGPWGGPYGGGPWGGAYGPGPYGGAPYGQPGAYGAPPAHRPAPAAATAAPSAPAAKASPPVVSSSEVDALRQRIRELESQQQPAAPPPPAEWDMPPSSSDWGSAPAFRPIDRN